jgi:glycerophosphoryl diester phosphodiesterase
VRLRGRHIVLGAALAVLLPVYVANASWLVRPEGELRLLAHRGVHQNFDREGLTRQSCTAEKSIDTGTRFLENTLPSIAAAFGFGADVVEIDVHSTTDGDFAVFHDWTLDCRTDGTGVVREHSMAELKALDVGYGYTYDGGRTYPLRGTGVGMMPSLAEVLHAFPEVRFLIDVKTNDPHEADRLARYLDSLPEANPARLAFYGGWRPIDRLRELRPEWMAFSTTRGERCLKRYLLTGWMGRVPDECGRSMIIVPGDYARLLWGWPYRFVRRMDAVGSEVYVGGGMDFRLRSVEGLDSPEQLEKLPASWRAGIFTDRIEVVGPLLGRDHQTVNPGSQDHPRASTTGSETGYAHCFNRQSRERARAGSQCHNSHVEQKQTGDPGMKRTLFGDVGGSPFTSSTKPMKGTTGASRRAPSVRSDTELSPA